MDITLLDQTLSTPTATTVENLVFNGAYDNGDGTYDILVTSDITEYATYWTYEAPGTPLRITVTEAPEFYLGYLAIATN